MGRRLTSVTRTLQKDRSIKDNVDEPDDQRDVNVPNKSTVGRRKLYGNREGVMQDAY